MRGPVRAVDAAATVPSPSDPASADASEPAGYTTRLTMTRHPEAEPVNPHGLWESPEEAEQERIKEDIRREVEQSAELDPANSTGKLTDDQKKLLGELQAHHPDVVDPRSEIKTSEDTEMEPMRTKEKRHYEEAVRFAAQLSERHNRKLDGLPPRMEDGQSAPKQARVDEIHYVELDSEEVMMAVTESRLSPEEKKKFVEAKRKSLVPWCENDAWRPVKRTQAPNGTIVPMRFLLRYKEDKPNARVILQGFKHRDVVQGKLDTESPTLSRLGKYLIVLVGCIKRWKFGTMDVKSAFLQSDYIHHKVELYGEPSADMRRLLSEMIGLKEHEVMMMTKPAFGDVRAPRQWNETADHALTKEVGLWKHRLDGCIYLSTRLATKEDAEFEVFEHNGVMMIVDGVFGLHVDDILAAGEGVTKAEDAYEPQGEPKCYAERLYVLLNRFKFGSVDYQDKQMFCGCQLTQAMDAGSVTFDLEKYLHQLKPLSIEKNRKANPGEKATPKEQSQLRGLLGGLAWPANQTQPHLAASVSLAQASSANATVGEMLEVNKVLRFAKETSTIPLKIRGHGFLKELRFGAYTDASWSTRPDGTSQGGWLIFVATEEEMSGTKPFPLTVVDWASKKLTRICRSSLAAEAQTMATAVDQLEWTKTMFALMVWPNQKPDNEDVMKWLGESPMITDARALFDASTSMSPGAKLAERRTAIEIQICVERMQAAGGALRWCNSHQQLADGMTKASARTKLAHELQRGVHCLRYDPEYTASKKVKHEDKEMEQDALNKAAEEFEVQRRVNEGIYTIADMETEEKGECKMCLLRGCGLPVEEGRKYCSKRHYHAAQGQAAKVAKKAAEGAVWMLTFAGEGGEAEAYDGLTYDFVPVYVMVFVGVFFAGFCMMIGYSAGRRAGWRDGVAVGRALREAEMVTLQRAEATEDRDQVEPEDEPETEEQRRARYLRSEMCEVSDPDEWQLIHHGTGESDSSEDEEEEVEINLDGAPGRPMTSTRFTTAQLRLLVAKGYYVFSDEEVQTIRDGFARDYIRPSFEEVFSPEMMQRVLNDQPTPVPFPSGPEEWNGMSAATQRAMWSRLDDALLLGCHFEEVTTTGSEEARLLRASLETVRVLEAEVARGRAWNATTMDGSVFFSFGPVSMHPNNAWCQVWFLQHFTYAACLSAHMRKGALWVTGWYWRLDRLKIWIGKAIAPTADFVRCCFVDSTIYIYMLGKSCKFFNYHIYLLPVCVSSPKKCI